LLTEMGDGMCGPFAEGVLSLCVANRGREGAEERGISE
jgi:hypothetical protein